MVFVLQLALSRLRSATDRFCLVFGKRPRRIGVETFKKTIQLERRDGLKYLTVVVHARQPPPREARHRMDGTVLGRQYLSF